MAREFNGSVSNFLEVGDVPAVDIVGTELTIHCWFRPDVNNVVMGLVAKNDTGVQGQYGIYMTNTGKLEGFIADGGGTNFDLATGAVTIGALRWHSAALLKRGTGADALSVWLDGLRDAAVTSNLAMTDQTDLLRFGILSSANPFDGALAEIAIWDSGLTSYEILALNRGVSPRNIRPGSLKGYWPLNDYGASGQSRDRSTYNNTATMTGSVPLSLHDSPAGLLVPRISPAEVPTVVTTVFTDSAEIYIDIQVSGVDVQEAGAGVTAVQPLHGVPTLMRPHSRVRMRLPEAAPPELFEELVDVAVVYVDIQISSVELRESIDADTVYIDITNTGGECYTSFTSEFLGEGEAFLEFYAEFDELEWSSSNDFLEWSPGVPVVEEEHC